MQNKQNIVEKFYSLISAFGYHVADYFKKFFYKIILIPLLFIKRVLKAVLWGTVKLFRMLSSSFKAEREAFSYDLKTARNIWKSNKNNETDERMSSSELFGIFFRKTMERHKPFVKRCFNILLPVAAAIVLLVVVNQNKNLDFALKVTYNNADIGYIENESVFRDAEDIIKTRLAFGGQEYSSGVVSQPEYKISIVRPNEKSDSNEISEKIIENSDSGLITACGVYIDEKFICSVKNESDASYVFKKLITDYCKENGIDRKDSKYIVDILESIKYVQGLYSESTVMTSEEIEEYIKEHKKSESTTYTASAGDTVESVRKKYKLSADQFYALNPSLKKDSVIAAGKKLNVIRNIPFINVTVSETVTEIKNVKFKTVEVETNSLYVGTSKIVKEGKDGTKKVTSLVTYVNGEKISKKEIKSVIIKKPVNEKTYVGTKPIPSLMELYGEDATFIWPTVGVDYVTSDFGYRMLYNELNFHRGLDISGAGALGKPVVASAAGTVEQVTSGTTGYGYSVLIDHGSGVKTRYGHCLAGSITVNVGDEVEQGQQIAQIGSTGNSTGPHLHFEIIYNGAYTNPLDYLTKSNKKEKDG